MIISLFCGEETGIKRLPSGQKIWEVRNISPILGEKKIYCLTRSVLLLQPEKESRRGFALLYPFCARSNFGRFGLGQI
jgi:hypothetical protein